MYNHRAKVIKGSVITLCKPDFEVYTSSMIKTNLAFLVLLAILAGVAPVLAGVPETRPVIGLMGPQAAPVAVDDAAIQKAIETLIKQHKTQPVKPKKKFPEKLDNPIGMRPLRDNDKVLIMGGAEIIPM
jgi:hypothetical protein